MRKLAFVAVLLLVGMLPLAASAQQSAPTVQASGDAVTINVTKVIAIGIGVVVGAVVLESFAFGEIGTLVGGVAGGFLGAWWYENQATGTTKVTIRQPASMTVASSGERLALSF